MAQNNGVSRQEIIETLLHIGPYAGFPAAWEGLALAREVLARARVNERDATEAPGSAG
jgi:4-carboxymuconolactone decarboxylase